jgi:hypothetical protein
MKIEVEPNCPLDKFKPCRQHKCAWFTQVRGTDPNTGNEVDEWGCAMSWMPMLILEGAAQSRSTGSAIESFRNEVVKANQDNLKVLADQFPPQTLKDKLIEG